MARNGWQLSPEYADSVQLLCRQCATSLGDNSISFRTTNPQLDQALSILPKVSLPSRSKVQEPEHWKQFLSRTLNLFFKSKAVNRIIIGKKGENYYHWKVELNLGHDPDWVDPHLEPLLRRIQEQKEKAGKEKPLSICISSPEKKDVTCSIAG